MKRGDKMTFLDKLNEMSINEFATLLVYPYRTTPGWICTDYRGNTYFHERIEDAVKHQIDLLNEVIE